MRFQVIASQLSDTQGRLESALVDLRKARSQWLAHRRQTAHSKDGVSKETKALRRTFRNASKSVQASLREWEALLADYMAIHT